MLALLFLTVSAVEIPVYYIEETDVVKLSTFQRVELCSIFRPEVDESWVVGNLPSEKIVAEEGRFSRRRKSEKEPEKNEQFFSFISGGGVPGDILSVEFWFIKPYFAEMYFNDPEAYAEMHGGMPKTKIIEFHIVSPGKPEDL